jgi:hypothetical protein
MGHSRHAIFFTGVVGLLRTHFEPLRLVFFDIVVLECVRVVISMKADRRKSGSKGRPQRCGYGGESHHQVRTGDRGAMPKG